MFTSFKVLLQLQGAFVSINISIYTGQFLCRLINLYKEIVLSEQILSEENKFFEKVIFFQ